MPHKEATITFAEKILIREQQFMNAEKSVGRNNKLMLWLFRAWLCLAPLLIYSPNLLAKDSATIFGLYTYNDAVPTAEQVLGHSLGTDINWTAEARRYFAALHDFAPQNVRLVDYGSSW